ncbi:hypothetical protein AYO22_08468 [Fonsecaea multimorphosa]|nr:hypothetical protein AYO22_08468 [Fonsecaea multimorphosa]
MTRTFDPTVPVPTHSCPREAIVAVAQHRDFCNNPGADKPTKMVYCTFEPTIELCCGAWEQGHEQEYGGYETVRRRIIYESSDPTTILTSRPFEWQLQEVRDNAGNIVEREVIKQQTTEFNMNAHTCELWRATDDQFAFYMQNLATFGVYDVDRTGRAIGTTAFWEWEPEGRWPPYGEQGTVPTTGSQPGIWTPKPGTEGNAQPESPQKLDDLITDYDQRREWFRKRLGESELHLHGAKDRAGEGCSKRLSPIDFESRIEKLGMRTDALNQHLPAWPTKKVWQNRRDREVARVLWKDFFAALNVCAETLENRLPSKPERAEYSNQEDWMAAFTNWRNLFTDEPLQKSRGTTPKPDRPKCPKEAMKKLAKLGKHLKDASVKSVPKEDAKWDLLDTYATELLNKGVCREQILVILAKPHRKAYSSFRKWYSDRRAWNKYISSLEKGEDAPLPKIDAFKNKQPTQNQPSENNPTQD